LLLMMIGSTVIVVGAFWIGVAANSDAVTHGSSMIRREEAGGQFQLPASASFPKKQVRLRQSAERQTGELVESSEGQPHEEDTSIQTEVVEMDPVSKSPPVTNSNTEETTPAQRDEETTPAQPDESDRIRKLEDEIATLKQRLEQDDALATMHGREPRRAELEDDENTARENGFNVHPTYEPASDGDGTYASANPSSPLQRLERSWRSHHFEPTSDRHPTLERHHRSHHVKRARNLEVVNSADTISARDRADSEEQARDSPWITKQSSPLQRLERRWRSHHGTRNHARRIHQAEVSKSEDSIDSGNDHDDIDAIRQTTDSERITKSSSPLQRLENRWRSHHNAEIFKPADSMNSNDAHHEGESTQQAIDPERVAKPSSPLQRLEHSWASQHQDRISSDEQEDMAQKIVSASRDSAPATRNETSPPGLATTSDSARSPRVSVSKAPIEFEPWLGTTNPPQFDPFGQDEYIQAPQMLAAVSLDDTGVLAPTTTAWTSGDGTGEADLPRSITAVDDAPIENDAMHLTESDGANEYGLSYPPTNRPQLEQYLRIAREMERVELMGGVSEQGARNAFKNLYVNWTHTDYNVRERYLSGIRIRIVGQQIFYSPEPPELRQLATSQPSAFERMFSIVAAHVLSFLTGTMGKFKLPNADFTIAFGDFCVGTTRLFHDAWGTKKRADVDASGNARLPNDDDSDEGAPNAEFTEAFQVPVFQWTNTQSGRKACNVITTSTYDWNWWGSNFTEGNTWRLDRPPPAWKQRLNKMVWRGSLLSQESIRSRAIRVGLRHPELFDIKGVKANDCEKFVADLAGFQDHNTLLECQASVSNFTPMEQQQKYKYTLEMDGGGTTFRLKNLLLGGFLVFKVDSDTTQFWSDSLQPFVHYIPVSKENFEHDLVQKLRWAMEHDTDCEHIAASARRFALEYLKDVDAHWQQQAAISVYAGRQNFIPIGPEPGMIRFCCKDAANVNLKPGVKLTGLASECVDHDPACATLSAPNEMLYSVPRLQDMMRASTLEELAQDINTTKEVILNVHNVSKLANPEPPVSNMQIWKDFADVLQPFRLVEGHVMQDNLLAQMLQSYASTPEVKTICEVGFNGGHSALLLLLSNPSAHVYSFDISRYSYTKPAMQFVSAHFPQRFTFIEGDSAETLPAFRFERADVKCDLAIVDGSHLSPWPKKDILNFWHLASGPESKVVMMDTACEISWCKGPSSAWKAMKAAGIVKEIENTKLDKAHGFSVGVFKKAPDADILEANAIEWPSVLDTSLPGQTATPTMSQSASIGMNILPNPQNQVSIEGPAISLTGVE